MFEFEHFIEEKIETLVLMIESNLWFVPILAFLAGILTSITPCSLTSIPLIISYVSGTRSREKKRAFWLSLLFAVGMAVVYTSLGMFASFLGSLLHRLGFWWYILLGVVMILMALQMFEIINIIPESLSHSRSKRKGYTGAFAAGMLGGLFASHCALPVLVVLLAIVAEGGSMVRGAFLLLLFALGHSIFVIIAGTFASALERMTRNKKYGILVRFIKVLMGIIMLLLAAYIIYIGIYDPH